MAINPLLNAVSSALAQQSAPVSVRTAAITANGTTQSNANIADSSPPQSVLQNAGLLSASSNFAQLGSLLEVAQSGTEQVGAILAQLQSIAQQAAGGGAGVDLGSLDSEFQQLLSQIDQTVNGTTFGGVELLDGTQSGNAGGQTQTFSLPDLSAQGLFASGSPDISTPQDAENTLVALSQAQDVVGNTGTSIGDLLGQLGFASASVDSALANGIAAASTLSEADLANGAAFAALSNFLSQSSTAKQAQTGNITGNLLSLLQE